MLLLLAVLEKKKNRTIRNTIPKKDSALPFFQALFGVSANSARLLGGCGFAPRWSSWPRLSRASRSAPPNSRRRSAPSRGDSGPSEADECSLRLTGAVVTGLFFVGPGPIYKALAFFLGVGVFLLVVVRGFGISPFICLKNRFSLAHRTRKTIRGQASQVW